MTRYIAIEKSSPGYETVAEVKRWIERASYPDMWTVVEITDKFELDPEAEKMILKLREEEKRAAYNRGRREMAQHIIRMLGLDIK